MQLFDVLATEDVATLETASYVVNVILDEYPHPGGAKYELNVCGGGMPPHARHFFANQESLEAYLNGGEVLDVTADDRRWETVSE